MDRSSWLRAVSGAVLVIVGALVAMRFARFTKPPAVVASASARPSATAMPASSLPRPPSLFMDFSFDCAGLSPAEDACPGASPLAAKLVESSLWTLVNGQPCAGALKAGRAAAAAHALAAAQALARQKLPALERALLQNAALRLLACSVNVEKEPQRSEIRRDAKRLIHALALNAAEIAALPSSAKQLAWLGDGSAWQVGTPRTHLHESADGYVSTLERAEQGPEFASIYRLILVDDHGELHATDVVSKLLLRRPTEAPGQFRVCVATLDLASAHCNAPALRPVSPALQSEALKQGDATPACHQCHVQNHFNTLRFGPHTGLGPDTVTLDQAREPLLKALQ